MTASELMTENPACCTPSQTVQEVAQTMATADCGCLPVVQDLESRQVIGVVTDRDLACRGLAQGLDSTTPVREVMSTDPICCSVDSDVQEIQQLMADGQVRRLPVVDESGCCIGMIAQADLVRNVSSPITLDTIEQISEPTDAPRARDSVSL